MKKLKTLWNENRVMFVLATIVIICFILILAVMIRYFFGGSKSSYGHRLDGIEKVKITEKVKKDFINKIKEDESIKDVDVKTKGRIIYVSISFKEDTVLIVAESKALSSIEYLDSKYTSYYDLNYTLKCDKTESSEGFLIMGSKNVNGTGLVWNNNTPIEKEGE